MSGPRHGRGPRMPTEKANDFGKAWGRLFGYMHRYRIAIAAAVVMACIGTVLTLLGPNMLSDMTDLIQEGIFGTMDLEAVVSIALTLVVIYATSSILTFLQQYIMTTVSQRTAYSFRRDISGKINRLPLRYFDSSTTGDVMSRVTNDVDTVGQSMNQSISTLVTSVTLLFGSIIMIIWPNWVMAATAILSSLLGFVFVFIVMSRSQKYFTRQQRDLGRMNGHVEEIYTGQKIMKAYGGEDSARKEFDGINDDLFRSNFMSQFLSGMMQPFMNFIGNFGYVMVCIVGAVMYVGGSISFGTIVAFMVYVRLFTQPLTQLAQAFSSMQSVAASAERIFAFLDEREMEDESEKNVRIDDVKGHVEFKDVHFGYGDREIIHGFSADIQPGQKVAIVGPTGAGKTTMVNLLMRFYDVKSGDILIDGVSVNRMRREDVHDLFCMVLQDTWLFEGTIRENIVYNSRETVTDRRLDEVCRAVGLHHFIETLPDRYETVLGDNATLSAGQRQQITIARAMVDGSPLLILDEATSSVDTMTEKVIQDAMDRLTEGRTSFVIAHRLSTIRNSDLILVMRDGNIVEQGTHDELLEKGGFYADLYNSQFEDME